MSAPAGTRVTVDGGTVHVVATVHGLASEEARVRDAFAAVRPRCVALGLSAESVAGLMHHLRTRDEPRAPRPEPPAVPRRHKDGTLVEEDVEDDYEYEAAELLTDSEVVYGLSLQQFGKVLLPPRDLLAAVQLAGEADIPVRGVDLSEEEYGDAFARHLGTWALMRYTRRTRRLERRPPKAASAREFALAWDAELRRVTGYDALEQERERLIAERARALAREHGTVLLIVEVAREDGVLAALR